MELGISGRSTGLDLQHGNLVKSRSLILGDRKMYLVHHLQLPILLKEKDREFEYVIAYCMYIANHACSSCMQNI